MPKKLHAAVTHKLFLFRQIVSPYDDKIPGNPIGTLQELCMSRRWPPPSYEMESEEGLPHERQFTIACTIFNHKEIGTILKLFASYCVLYVCCLHR